MKPIITKKMKEDLERLKKKKKNKNKELMGEKEFFDKMKQYNQYLSMSERYKIAHLVKQMVEDV